MVVAPGSMLQNIQCRGSSKQFSVQTPDMNFQACSTSTSCTPSQYHPLVSPVIRAPPQGSLRPPLCLHMIPREGHRSKASRYPPPSLSLCLPHYTPWRNGPREYRGFGDAFTLGLDYVAIDEDCRSHEPKSIVKCHVQALARFDVATTTCSRPTFRSSIPSSFAPQRLPWFPESSRTELCGIPIINSSILAHERTTSNVANGSGRSGAQHRTPLQFATPLTR
jgi:hypothetical protein